MRQKAEKIAGGILVGMLVVVGVAALFHVLSPESHDVSQMPITLVNVVKIKVIGEYDNTWEGTGVFIKDDLILTAGHIVDRASEVYIVCSDETEYDANDWYLETEADLGLIEVKTPCIEKEMKFDSAALGETVWACGNPFGVFPVLTKGIVSAVNMPDEYMGTKKMTITDCAVNPGNSGCPLMDEDGNILGICSWGYDFSQGMSYFVRAQICELMLDKYFAIRRLEEIE